MILPGISRTGASPRPFVCGFGSPYGENSVGLGLDESNINREETEARTTTILGSSGERERDPPRSNCLRPMVLGIIVLLFSIHWHASRHVMAARHCFLTFPHFSFLLPWLKQSFFYIKKRKQVCRVAASLLPS